MGSNGHGGARPGAGRKPRAEKFESQIAAGDQLAADNLVGNVTTLQELATLDREVVHETWEPAGTVLIDDVISGGEGKPLRIKRLAFPDKPADELVLVQRRVVRSGPSESAAIYLVDRIAGKPAQATEMSGPDGAPVEHVHMSLDEWKAQAQQRVAVAEQTLAALTEDDDA